MSFQEIGSLFDPVALSSNHRTYARLTLAGRISDSRPFRYSHASSVRANGLVTLLIL
jgi:hypothetical protein